jgi:DNA-binding IclR family transcriptional regulator
MPRCHPSASETIGGVIDLAFPVFDQDEYAKASLVVPLLAVIGRTPATETVKARVAQAAQRISAVIGGVAAMPAIRRMASHSPPA